MKIHIFLFALGFSCLLSFTDADCNLGDEKQDVPFPDITQSVADSYIMGVEYSIPGATQTDYYTEYYELLFKRGRIDSHINGVNKQYIYESETWEAWTIDGKNCTLQNNTITPGFFKEAMTDWRHFRGSENPTTVGPSAMFKIALDVWNKSSDRDEKMAYMGNYYANVRGEKAVYWRRCLSTGGYVDYIFADSGEENAFDVDDLKRFSPLRVSFFEVSGPNSPLSTQIYDIISFQHFIPKGIEPFQLPKGLNCQRGSLVDGPTLPDFSANSLLLNGEVVYEKLNKEGDVASSYYSTLMFALDRESDHLAYYFSPWETTKSTSDKPKETNIGAPLYVIYDMKHQYVYRINFTDLQCQVSRDKSFIPQYKIPENGGSLALTDPYVLFPNNELTFLTEGTDRGLAVNIFEAEIKNYLLDATTIISRAIVTHSYLKPNEQLENTVEVRNAPTQMQLRFFRQPNGGLDDILTFNVFGFTTRIPMRRYLFDVARCFKNDDDYLYLTIGFEIENQYLPQIEKALPKIEEAVMSAIYLKSELNPVRVPSVMTDLKDNYVYVTMVILGKPTLQLDFTDRVDDMTIKVSSNDDTQGVSDFDTCASNCLENRNGDCWGFSMCGSTCYYGSNTNTVVEPKKNCTLFRRYSNTTLMLSKEAQANNIVGQVRAGDQFNIMVPLGDKMVTLTATSADITNPAEDDEMFEKMGNLLNPRMQVVKAGGKLKAGTTVKNLGKLRYDECQSLCLDFKTCETVSFCLKKSQCMISTKYGSDLKPEEIESNDLCILLTRKYGDHFERTPGVFIESETGTKKDIDNVEDCARACLKEDGFKCLSFDHCAGDKKGCTLYTVHYLNQKERKAAVKGKEPRCGHYTRKFSTEFKRKDQTRFLGTKVPPITNLTLEECAKTCVEYGEGTCFGYDFCQDSTLYATTCIIIDSDPSRMKSSYSPVCTNYFRTEGAYAPRPYSNSYAGGIGFLCFLVGGLIGAVIVFVIAYIRSNRG